MFCRFCRLRTSTARAHSGVHPRVNKKHVLQSTKPKPNNASHNKLFQAAKDGSGFLVDGYQRVRIFRGFNDIQHSSRSCQAKSKGPYIRHCNYLPYYLRSDSVLSLLEEQGFNVVRTPMMWAATRPEENTTDFVYLQDSKTIVDKVIHFSRSLGQLPPFLIASLLSMFVPGAVDDTHSACVFKTLHLTRPGCCSQYLLPLGYAPRCLNLAFSSARV